MKKWEAMWICDKAFFGLHPLNRLHKQHNTGIKTEHRQALKNHHMLVRKAFHVTGSGNQFFLELSADDYYKLYINGRYVAQGPAPGYPFHYYYNLIDVTPFICPGENVIAIHVYYQGLVNRVWCSGDYRQGLIAELYCKDDLILKTDKTWKYTNAKEYIGTKVFGYDTQFVEDIDNRRKIRGWQTGAFDDSSWLCCIENENDDHQLYPQTTPLIDIYEAVPRTIECLKEGHYRADFGREITGHVELTACGSAGDQVMVLYGEELKQDGSVRFDMRCNCFYKDLWILADGENQFEPFDYKAFRYVEIIAPPGRINPESIKAVVRHYPMDEDICKFTSENTLLNNIWDMCKNGVRLGSQEVYVDCPSREKGQYLGDATVTALSQVYLTGDLRLFRKHLEEFALSCNICPGMMAVAPCSYMQEIADFSLLWPYQLLTYYMHSGDIGFLKRMLPVAEGILGYFRQYEREDGLLENVKEKWNLVDWPEEMRDGYDFDLSSIVGDGCHNVINALYLGAVKTTDIIRGYLGLLPSGVFERVKTSFIQAFFREQTNLFADSVLSDHCSLHANIFPLFYGFVPEYAKSTMIRFIREKGLSCGVFNSFFLLRALARAGEYDLVFDLITSEHLHSWSNMLKEGATTCFEAWGKDQKWNTSLCHPWASAPIPVLIEDIIGIRPGTPGWETVHFEPHIPEKLTTLMLEIHTKIGRIFVRHKNGETEMEMNTLESN